MTRRGALVIGVTLAVAAVLGVLLTRLASRWIQADMMAEMERRFDARLALDGLDLSVFPSLRVSGRGLRLHRGGDVTGRPLITVATFTATSGPWKLWQGRIERLDVTGLEIYIAPDGGDAEPADDAVRTAAPASGRGPAAEGWLIEEVVSTGARLEIAPDDPTGTPLEFDILEVRLLGFAMNEPAGFTARLINPRPRGEITTQGFFGPWNPTAPRHTPLSGDYVLEDADMSVFGGLAGTLDSAGSFTGELESIAVTGRTAMADFQVETGRHPLPLDTTFEARVDGTNGNTYLDRVAATLAGSPFEARGEIAGQAGSEGKTIRLDTHAVEARLEDFIRLVVDQDEPPMAGVIGFDARMELPPGDAPVLDRMRLDGRFSIRRGRFASDTVQEKVDELSRRGQGEPKNDEIAGVLSDFSGRFNLRDATLHLPDLSFAVRGATVELSGTYGLRGERLDFEGHLKLDAKLSQATTGFKSVLLKIIDPFFRRHGGGAVLPIRIRGTVNEPDFGVRMFGR